MRTDLDNDELEVLKLPPKFCILEELDDETFELEIERMNAKLRYDGMGKSLEDLIEERKPDSEKDEETRRVEEIGTELELETRRVFDRKTKEVDMKKLRATDMKNNTCVILPKPLIPKVESEMSVRKEEFKRIFKKYKDEKTREGRQKTNLNDTQKRGLKKLQK